jgi:hypothetical protein
MKVFDKDTYFHPFGSSVFFRSVTQASPALYP